MFRIRKQIGGEAFCGPGCPPTWATAKKVGFGTSYKPYSKVWFTLADGAVTEVYYPTLDTANTKILQFLITDGKTFVDREDLDTEHKVELVHPKALAFRLINTDKEKKYRIKKTVITDTKRDSLAIKVKFEALLGKLEDYRLYIYYDPHIDNGGWGDTGYYTNYRGKDVLIAYDHNIYSALVTSIPWSAYSTGYYGVNDGYLDLKENKNMFFQFDIAYDGNIIQTAELDMRETNEFVLILSFGRNELEALNTAMATLERDFPLLEKRYIGEWKDFCNGLNDLNGNATPLYYVSMMVLKALEDKTYRGAMIASPSVPWGEAASDDNKAGYHLVWSRDLYHTAMAFLAAGHYSAPNRSLDYLDRIQQKEDGSFPQNSWLNGHPFWNSVQMDEVADPIILAWRMGRIDLFYSMVVPAADYILKNGPKTPQERWEENGGYSPSSIAAQIAGLVCASEIAREKGDIERAKKYLEVADEWQAKIDEWCFTETGFHGDGKYYIRIAPNGRPNRGDLITLSNGAGTFDQREIVDVSFLEMVRLGVKPPDDSKIRLTLAVVDKEIKRMTLKGPCWYRYNHDGYGETEDGKPYCGIGKGRLWPIFTGERGHYELALGNQIDEYLKAMENFANQGYMLPEQVFEETGEPTGAATPLAWSHAEYVRLLVSKHMGYVVDTPKCVYNRYVLGKKNRKAITITT